MGGIINGAYDISGSMWVLSPERSRLTDNHFSLIDSPMNIYFNLKPGSSNFLMFINPLSIETWKAVVICFASIISIRVIVQRIVSKDGPGSRMFQLLTWLVFIVVHGVYSGALTTNFIVQPDFPFETVTAGLSLYPEWKMCLLKGVYFFIQVCGTCNQIY